MWLLDKATQTGEVHKKSCHVTINGSITSSIRIAARKYSCIHIAQEKRKRGPSKNHMATW